MKTNFTTISQAVLGKILEQIGDVPANIFKESINSSIKKYKLI